MPTPRLEQAAHRKKATSPAETPVTATSTGQTTSTDSNRVLLDGLRGAEGAHQVHAVARAAMRAAGMAWEPTASNQAMCRRLGRSAEDEGLALAGRATGRPLPGPVRERMEAAFGRDLGGVRIHTDGNAAQAAERLHAHAFALGADLFFAAGSYDPGTPRGDRLLAHELTHVVQHFEGRLPSVQSGESRVSSPTDPAELEAYANEDRILARLPEVDRSLDASEGAAPAPACSEAPGPAAKTAHRDEDEGEDEDGPRRLTLVEMQAHLADLLPSDVVFEASGDVDDTTRPRITFSLLPPEEGYPEGFCPKAMRFEDPLWAMQDMKDWFDQTYPREVDESGMSVHRLATLAVLQTPLYTAWRVRLPSCNSPEALLSNAEVPESSETDDEAWLDHLAAGATAVSATMKEGAEVDGYIRRWLEAFIHIQLPGEPEATFRTVEDLHAALSERHRIIDDQIEVLRTQLNEDREGLHDFGALESESEIIAALTHFWVDELESPNSTLFGMALNAIGDAETAVADASSEELGQYYSQIAHAASEVDRATEAVAIHYRQISTFMTHRAKNLATAAAHIREARNQLASVLLMATTPAVGGFVRQIGFLQRAGLGNAAAYMASESMKVGVQAALTASDAAAGKSVDWGKFLEARALDQALNLVPIVSKQLTDPARVKATVATFDMKSLTKGERKLVQRVSQEGITILQDTLDNAAKDIIAADLSERGGGKGLPADYDQQLLRKVLLGSVKRQVMAAPKKREENAP